jgi:hypothetical protein
MPEFSGHSEFAVFAVFAAWLCWGKKTSTFSRMWDEMGDVANEGPPKLDEV